MKNVVISGKVANEERETVFRYNTSNRIWEMYTLVMKHYRKAIKKGWTQTEVFLSEDGDILGGCFEAPEYAVSVRNAEKQTRTKTKQ